MIDRRVPAARPRRQFAVPILLAAGSGVLFFWNLGRASLQDWDEATYAEIFTGGYINNNLGTNSNQSWGFVQLWMNF